MNRLQKKCLIVSTGLHLLLVAIIVIGPAFTSSTTSQEVREINFIPSMVVAENIAGGGNPNAGGAPAAVVPPTPPPPRTPVQPPPQVKPEARSKPELDRQEPAKSASDWTTKRKKKLDIVTKPQMRPRSVPKPRDNSAEVAAEARKAAEARNELARAFANAATGIREGSASATAINTDEDNGPGGGGPAYAGYDSLVQMVYQNAWVKPSDTSADAPVAYATVTIARDGSVVPGSARILTRSHDGQMDSSVQRVLDRVSTIGRPFPEGMKEKQRTYKIRFDLTKRSLT